jgi:hypothetical protein
VFCHTLLLCDSKYGTWWRGGESFSVSANDRQEIFAVLDLEKGIRLKRMTDGRLAAVSFADRNVNV